MAPVGVLYSDSPASRKTAGGCRAPGRGGENLIALESLDRRSSRFWFHRSHSGSEVDLIFDRGDRRNGVEIKLAVAVGPRDAAGLVQARGDGVIHLGLLLHHGEREFSMEDGIRALPVGPLLRGDTRALE